MRASDLFRFSTDNLRRRKGRTILTIIGVVVGVCAIVVMVSLGIAVSRATEEMLQGWGDLRTITVYNHGAKPDTQPLDDLMVQNFKQMDHVLSSSPIYQSGSLSGTVNAGSGNRYATEYAPMVGMDPEALAPMGYELVTGRYPSAKPGNSDTIDVLVESQFVFNFVDTRKGQNNPGRYKFPNYPSYEEAGPGAAPTNLPQYDENGVLLNPEEFFFDIMNTPLSYRMNYGYDETTGEPKYKDYKLNVVGIINAGQDYNVLGNMILPVESMKKLEKDYKRLSGTRYDPRGGGGMVFYGGPMMGGASDGGTVQVPGYNTVYVKVDDVANMPTVEKAISDLGYQIQSMSQTREQLQGQVAQTQMMLGSLAAVSLFVAALNIANTMTMAIYERTREIGVMKVLGCKLSNIRAMFLIESGAIGLLGGIIGVIVSFLISGALNYMPEILAWLGISANIDVASLFGFGGIMNSPGMKLSIIQPWLVILALCFATGVGVVSGIAPAGRAVKISSLEAIRHE